MTAFVGFPTATGTVNLGSGGSARYVPQLWNRLLIENFYPNSVLHLITTSDHTGEISELGDSVVIRGLPAGKIHDGVDGQNLKEDELEPYSIQLNIDQYKYYNYRLNDVQRLESDIEAASAFAAVQAATMAVAIDADVLAWMAGATTSQVLPGYDPKTYTVNQADATNRGLTAGARSKSINLGTPGTPLRVTPGTIGDLIVDMNIVLGENFVPNRNKYVVWPLKGMGCLQKSDLKIAAFTGEDKSIMLSSVIGTYAELKQLSSNSLPYALETVDGVALTPCYWIPFGIPMSTAFVTQIAQAETLRSELSFASKARGQQVYGRTCLKPTALGFAYCCFPKIN